MPLAVKLRVGESLQIGADAIITVRERKTAFGREPQIVIVVHGSLPVEKLPAGVRPEDRRLTSFVLGTDGTPQRAEVA